MGDDRWYDLHDRMAADHVGRFRGRLIKTTGDGVMPPSTDQLARFAAPPDQRSCAALGIEVRAGLHAGEVELRGDDIGGIAVHTAARVMSHAGPGEILVSDTVDPVVGSGIAFADRGEHELRGLEGRRRHFAHLP